jgi:predicted peptidase
VLEKINLWISKAVILIPCLLILNFLSELKNEKINFKAVNPLNFILYLAAVTTCILIFITGREVVNESIATGHARNVIGESARGIAKPFEARIYTDHGDTMRYRLLKPFGYNTAKKYPIVVLLHHGGAHGSDNIKQVEGSEAPYLSNYENIRKYPAFLFVPQCPQNMNWMSPAINISVVKTLQVLEKEFSIDVKRRYVMGVSGGGYGSWHFIGAHPGMFAAAIPICGGGNPRQAKNMLDVAIWAFHGKNDGLAPVSGTREIIAAIKHEGGKPRYTEFPDEGHDIGRKVKITPGLLDWLFSQRRNEKAPE